MEDKVIDQLRNKTLHAQIVLLDRVQTAREKATNSLDRLRKGESGQTPTEYLMIVGLMAVVIITVFVTFYWDQIKVVAKTWVANVKNGVSGSSIK
jgi:Flp pilus assembly pilin Flp